MLTIDTITAIQSSLANAMGMAAGVADEGVLQRVVAKPLATLRGLPAYPTLFNRVAVLIQGIIYEKPFVAANAPVALACAQRVLAQGGYALHADPDEFDKLAKGIEMGFTTWQRITVWLKKNTTRCSP